ncbi:hypothetical protein [Streptomyces sp. NPDC006739]|uniref:hypothetical protein n=1 Tax=Streptomyces sp. NPDC006739 TaxID=3364763 RepID=UPI0036A1C7C7
MVAVQTLSVTVPAPVALDILQGRRVGQSGLVQAIPRDIDMAEPMYRSSSTTRRRTGPGNCSNVSPVSGG